MGLSRPLYTVATLQAIKGPTRTGVRDSGGPAAPVLPRLAAGSCDAASFAAGSCDAAPCAVPRHWTPAGFYCLTLFLLPPHSAGLTAEIDLFGSVCSDYTSKRGRPGWSLQAGLKNGTWMPICERV